MQTYDFWIDSQKWSESNVKNNLRCLIFITSWSIAEISWICKCFLHYNTSRLLYSKKVFGRTINGDETWQSFLTNKQTAMRCISASRAPGQCSAEGLPHRACAASIQSLRQRHPFAFTIRVAPIGGGGEEYLWAAHLHTRPCGCHHGDILHAGRRDGAFQFISFSFSPPAQTLGSAPVSFIGRV